MNWTDNFSPYTQDAGRLPHPEYRADIDGLRAIAVLSVVGFHAFPRWFQGGFVGVDVFFVISGFLISTIIFGGLAQGTFSFVEFYGRRIKRIFPALLLVLIASFVFGWFALLAVEYRQLGKHIAGGAGFLSNFVLWNESGYFDDAAETKPLLHLWSLGIEEQFYIIWPLLLWVAWKRRLNLLATTIAVGAISFALNLGKAGSDVTALFYSPQTRFWELTAGSVLAYITLHKHDNLARHGQKPDTRSGPMACTPAHEDHGDTLRNFQSLLGAALIALSIRAINKEMHFPGWWAVLPIAGTVLIIASGAQAGLNRAVLSNRVLGWFGLISFPLYLWHWPLLSFARLVEDQQDLSMEMRIAAVLSSIALAWLTYRVIEKPLRRGMHSKAKTITLLALMLVVGYVGYNCYDRDGLAFRPVNRGAEFYLYNWQDGFRFQKCYLDADDSSANTFADFCIGNAGRSDNKPLVLLWGDSHAASLYRGLLNQSLSSGYGLAQYTTSACPPSVNFRSNNRECRRINDFVLQQIRRYRPDTVILSAYWFIYDGMKERPLLDDKTIEETITTLKSFDIKHVVLVGQLPTFKASQPIIARDVLLADKSNRTFRNLDFKTFEADRRIGSIAKNNNVGFVSPAGLLCNAGGCLISISANRIIPLAFDYGHLTEEGSNFLIQRAMQQEVLTLPKWTP